MTTPGGVLLFSDSEGLETMEFVAEENQFFWHYSYEGVNVNQEFNVPLYWHRNHVFFNNLASGIWEFNIESESKVILKLKGYGAWDSMKKK